MRHVRIQNGFNGVTGLRTTGKPIWRADWRFLRRESNVQIDNASRMVTGTAQKLMVMSGRGGSENKQNESSDLAPSQIQAKDCM